MFNLAIRPGYNTLSHCQRLVLYHKIQQKLFCLQSGLAIFYHYLHTCMKFRKRKSSHKWIFEITLYSKTCLRRQNEDRKLIFKTNYRLMQVKSIAKCSKSLEHLRYFRPSFSYHLSFRRLFCLFLSGHLRQDLLYLRRHINSTITALHHSVTEFFMPGHVFYGHATSAYVTTLLPIITHHRMLQQAALGSGK